MRHLSLISTKARPTSKPREIEAAVTFTQICEPRVELSVVPGIIAFHGSIKQRRADGTVGI